LPLTELTVDQRQSIGDATQFIRTAGRREDKQLWKEKAAAIDDMLEKKTISIDSGNSQSDLNLDTSDPKSPKLNLGPGVKFPKDQKDPEFIKLVGLLVYAADRLKGHSVLETYDDQLAFFKAVNAGFEKYFKDLSKDEQDAMQKRKHGLEKDVEYYRKKEAEKPPVKKQVEPPKSKKVKIEWSPEEK
jgi:hypothetical protein